MNKKIKNRLAALFAAMSITLIFICRNEYLPPEKPKVLSENTVWFGDCDGGNWIQLVNINREEKLIRLKIYRDYDGILEMDANFKLGVCDFNDINESNWKEKLLAILMKQQH